LRDDRRVRESQHRPGVGTHGAGHVEEEDHPSLSSAAHPSHETRRITAARQRPLERAAHVEHTATRIAGRFESSATAHRRSQSQSRDEPSRLGEFVFGVQGEILGAQDSTAL